MERAPQIYEGALFVFWRSIEAVVRGLQILCQGVIMNM